MSHVSECQPSLIPCLTVKDASKSIDFYEKAFSFQVLTDPTKDEKGKIVHVEMGYGNAIIMFSPEGAWGSTAKAPSTLGITCPAITFYVYTQNVDTFYLHATQNGAKSVEEPVDTFWGDRHCRLKDPDGYIWSFATKNS